MATATILAGTTVAATAHQIRGTAGRAVQITPWMTAMGGTAEAVPQTGATIATAHPVALLTALLIVLLIIPLAVTGPPTILGTTPPPDAGPTPQTPTAGMPLHRDRPAAMRSPL